MAKRNLACWYDDRLREVPASRRDFEAEVEELQAALTGAAGVERAERLRVLGSRLRILDRILEAEQALNESIRLASDAGDAVGAARARLGLAQLALRRRRYDLSSPAFAALVAECEVDPALDGVLDAVLHHQGRDFFQQRRYAEAEESLGRATRLRLERGAEGLAGVAVEALRRARAARRAERRATRFRRYGLAPTALAVAALVYGLVVLSAPPGAVGEALFGVVVATVVVGGWSGGVCWAYTTPRTRSWGVEAAACLLVAGPAVFFTRPLLEGVLGRRALLPFGPVIPAADAAALTLGLLLGASLFVQRVALAARRDAEQALVSGPSA